MGKLDTKATAGVLYLLLIALTIPVSLAVVAFSVSNNSSRKINAQTPVISVCDFNRDGWVNNEDYLIVAKGFGKVATESANIAYDLDHDGWVNSKDLDAVSSVDPKVCTK